jgi:pimeloyl-ACP methyl ester carboxylesterase
MYNLLGPLYAYDPLPPDRDKDDSIPPFDLRAHTETWADMLRLQQAGIYPATFAAIHAPVLMLHGDYDPHPGPMIRASLAPYLPQLEYHEWPHCGNTPWQERSIRPDFFATLRTWLTHHLRHNTEHLPF